MSENSFESWAILELMGHRRLAGYLTEQEIGGTNMLRIDVPKANDTQTAEGNVAAQFYSSAAVYAITPTTEDVARKVALHCQPAPGDPIPSCRRLDRSAYEDEEPF